MYGHAEEWIAAVEPHYGLIVSSEILINPGLDFASTVYTPNLALPCWTQTFSPRVNGRHVRRLACVIAPISDHCEFFPQKNKQGFGSSGAGASSSALGLGLGFFLITGKAAGVPTGCVTAVTMGGGL